MVMQATYIQGHMHFLWELILLNWELQLQPNQTARIFNVDEPLKGELMRWPPRWVEKVKWWRTFKVFFHDLTEDIIIKCPFQLPDTEKQNAINLFLGVYIPSEASHPIWELTSDYLLHHSLTRGVRPCHRYSHMCVLLMLIFKYEGISSTL